jgi:trypsin
MAGVPFRRSGRSCRALGAACVVIAVVALAFQPGASSGSRVTGAIIGGHHVPIRQHPWQVELYKLVEEEGFVKHCGGSIRDSRHVITAAHCVLDGGSLYPGVASPFGFKVGYGSANVNRTRRVGVKAISVDPRFTRFSGRRRAPFAHDAAVLTLTRRIRFGRHRRAPQPVALATEAEFKRFFEHGVFATGWGRIRRRATEVRDPLLRGAALPAWSRRRCVKVYNNHKRHLFDPALMACAGARRSGRNGCSGDSGGPITVDTRPGRRVRRKLVGIVSFGRPVCGENGTPTVFTWVQSELIRVIRQRHPRPAPVIPGPGRQRIHGRRRVGQRVTCDPGDIRHAHATEFVWWRRSPRGGHSRKFAEPRKTVTLPAAARGQRVSCDVRYETAGGFFYAEMPARHATRPIGRR